MKVVLKEFTLALDKRGGAGEAGDRSGIGA